MFGGTGGFVVSDPRLITARSLLLGYLELRRLSPELTDWTEERLSGNPPRLVRLRRLAAMFRAFGLPWDPPGFAEGNFIQPEDPRYAGALARLAARMPRGAPGRAAAHHLPDFFAILFDYRTRVDSVLSFSSGVLEAGGLYLSAYRTAEELNQVIRDHVAIVDDILVALVSPEGASFSVEALARDYGYPDVDLLAIDVEWC